MPKRYLAIVATIIVHATTTQQLSIQCDFNEETQYKAIDVVYECNVTNALAVHAPNTQITSVDGIHYLERDHSDVTGVRMKNKSIYFLPAGFAEFFPALEVLYVSACGLREIHQSDLAPFTHLRNLDLSSNRLAVIERDLLLHNTNLEVVFLAGNPLRVIDTGSLRALPSLRFLKLRGGCATVNVKCNRKEVVHALARVQHECEDDRPSADELEREIKRLRKEHEIALRHVEEAQRAPLHLKQTQRALQHAEKVQRALRQRVKLLVLVVTVLAILLVGSSLLFLYTRLFSGKKREDSAGNEYRSIDFQGSCNTSCNRLDMPASIELR